MILVSTIEFLMYAQLNQRVNTALRRFLHYHGNIAIEGSQKSGLCPTLIQDLVVFYKFPYVVLVITLYPSQKH